MFFSPNFPIFVRSVTQSLAAAPDLAVKMIQKIQDEDICSISPVKTLQINSTNTHKQCSVVRYGKILAAVGITTRLDE